MTAHPSPLPNILRDLHAAKGSPLTIVMPPAVAFPTPIIDALPADVPMTILTMHMPRAYQPRPNIRWVSAFYSHAEREMAAWGNIEQIDINFSDVARMYLAAEPDLLITQATWRRESLRGDIWSLGPNADYTSDLIDAGVPVYVVENHYMPWVQGNVFGRGKVKVVGAECATETLYSVQARKPTQADHAMAQHIAPHIPPGATVQLGVGGLAQSIAQQVSIGEVWTEAIGDWVMTLPAGTKVTACVAFGSPALYEWMDNNPDVTMLPASITNDKEELRARKVYSVNQAMMINLDGGTSLKPGYSGKGGGAETTYGAYCSFVAAPETRNGQCNLGHAGYTLHDPTMRPRFLVSTQGIADVWPHPGFAGTQVDVERAIIWNLAAPEHFNELFGDYMRAA